MLDFEKAARQGLIDETKAKIEVFASYLPTELSDEELEKVVAEVISAATNQDFGPLMGQVMRRVGNRADGTRVTAFDLKATSYSSCCKIKTMQTQTVGDLCTVLEKKPASPKKI